MPKAQLLKKSAWLLHLVGDKAPPATSDSSEVASAVNRHSLRVAFKFGQRVHFELRRKMLKPPIARLPAN